MAEKEDLLRDVRLKHGVIGAKWNEQDGLWEIQVQRPDGTLLEDRGHFFINGTGILK